MFVFKLLLLVLLTVILTGAVRRYALQKNIIDVPNKRSSHKVPTPRGGGIAFVSLFLICLPWLAADRETIIALFGGGILVATVGWIDDRVSLSAKVRGFVHTLAACWGLAWLGGIPEINIGATTLSLGLFGWVLGVVGIVWLVNLYNFMDGIDGLAGSEAVSTSAMAGALLYFNGFPELGELVWMLGAAVLGFLVWNWPPAKIFMGDVASGFLGYAFAVLAISSEKQGGLPIILWAVLLGVFVVDATATLLRRIRRGERWYEPHRSHAYQRATQSGFSHKQVTIGVIGINLCLGMLVWAAWRWTGLMLPLVAGSIVALFFLWRFFVSDRESYRSGTPSVEGRIG